MKFDNLEISKEARSQEPGGKKKIKV